MTIFLTDQLSAIGDGAGLIDVFNIDGKLVCCIDDGPVDLGRQDLTDMLMIVIMARGDRCQSG